MQINYFGTHAALAHFVLSEWGYSEEELNSVHIYVPLIILCSSETLEQFQQSVLEHQELLHSVLVNHGVNHLLYTLQELITHCEDSTSCLWDTVDAEKLQQAWDRVESEILPALAEPTCVISFH
ncbi:hypothetical protein [Vibrio diazotrophicus]|uniref:hypothetical protein n=1 Tax=Vibrio diazotrophicus TaxID=685 RepID=UPI00142D2406|nr:hypothetical protein [Vibrio diazotrophicus]NIY94290.1 hypothetical protein [Vibrio diazotrophicus]